jgi:hypothetical protein
MRASVPRRAGEACQCLEPAHVPAERPRRARRRSGGSGTRR